jgi:O6-methylguanine-DNA--protein-cysteine methyltransferase
VPSATSPGGHDPPDPAAGAALDAADSPATRCGTAVRALPERQRTASPCGTSPTSTTRRSPARSARRPAASRRLVSDALRGLRTSDLTDEDRPDQPERPPTDDRDRRPARFDAAGPPPVLAGADVSYVVEDLAVGRLLLAARPDGTLLTSAYVADGRRGRRPARPAGRAGLARRPARRRGARRARRQLDEYLAGAGGVRAAPPTPVLATPFQRTVLDRLARDVGYGTTTSYGALAAAIGGRRRPARWARRSARTRCASCCRATGWWRRPAR